MATLLTKMPYSNLTNSGQIFDNAVFDEIRHGRAICRPAFLPPPRIPREGEDELPDEQGVIEWQLGFDGPPA
jgi:hypothetical protein